MSAGAGPSTIHVPPLPDKLRAEPRQEEIGPGRPYANAAAFSADHARWEQERDARRKLMAERLKAQKKVHEQSRDRTARQRPPDDGDRREKQRQQQHSSARSQSFKTPTIQLFFQLANLTWLVLNSSASGVRERLLSAWEKVLGRRPPPSATIQYSVREPPSTLGGKIPVDMQQVQRENAQRIVKLQEMGAKKADLDRHFIDEVFIRGLFGRGARMYLEEDHRSDEIRVRCYDGHWKREGSFLEFTGRGCVKFSNGEFHDGEFVDGHLVQGFWAFLLNGREEIVKVNRRDVAWRTYMEQGQPMMARLTETSDRITHESEAMQNWFEEQRRVPGSYFCIIMGGIHQRPGTLVLTDDLLREWRASSGYQTFCKENKWPLRCVSEDVYRRLDADLIRKNNITCEGFPQLPFQFAYDSLLDRMCRSHERDSELRAMLRGCSHYSFTRKDLEEREQAREEQIEELNSQIEDLSASILSDLRREVDAMSPYEVLMNAPQPWSEFSPEEWLDMHMLRPQEHRLAAVRVRIAELRALNWNTELSQLEKPRTELDSRAAMEHGITDFEIRRSERGLRCVSEDLFRSLSVEEIKEGDVACDGFPQLPYQYAYDALLQRFFNGHARVAELKELLKAKDEKEWKKNMLERSMEHIFDPPQIRELKAQIRSDLCRVINAMSPYEVLMNAPFHETPATSDLLDCDLKYDADTLEHFSSPFGYEGPECSFTSLF